MREVKPKSDLPRRHSPWINTQVVVSIAPGSGEGAVERKEQESEKSEKVGNDLLKETPEKDRDENT